MTDQELEQRLRGWYRAEIGPGETAPASLRTSVAAIPRARSGSVRPFGGRRGMTLLAAAAVLLVGGALAVGSGLVRLPVVLPTPPAPEPSLSLQTAPSPNPTEQVSLAPAAWSGIGNMSGGTSGGRGPGLTATLLRDGRVLVVGGARADGSAELYDPATRRWTATGALVHARLGQTAALLPDGKVLAFGGGDAAAGSSLASAELYDPGSGRWTLTGSMTLVRGAYAATSLADGRVLVAGGRSGEGAAGRPVASAEVYDPTSGRWSATGSMNLARDAATATLLNDGKVLLAGGSDGNGDQLASAELYDPTTGQWTLTGSMGEAGSRLIETLLHDGRVLVTGFRHPTAAELYDPTTGRWILTGDMTLPRSQFTATLLPDGHVLVAGGMVPLDGVYFPAVDSAEVYDPSTGRWTATASMAGTRGGHAATLLPDGTVLVAGGHDRGEAFMYLATAELYRPGPLPTGASPTPQPTLTPGTVFSTRKDMFLGLDQYLLASDTVGWVTTSAGFYRTTDMGTTWTERRPPGWSSTAATSLVDADTMYAASEGAADGMPVTIAATHDGGVSWVESTIDDPSIVGGPILFFQSPSKGFATFDDRQGEYRLRVYATIDGGATWTGPSTGTVPVIEASMRKLEGPSGGVLFLTSGKYDNKPFNDHFVLSMDGGATWKTRSFPIGAVSPRGPQKKLTRLWLEDSSRIVMAISVDGAGQSVWESDDDARSWRLVKALPRDVTNLTGAFRSPTEWVLYASDGSVVWSSVDSGEHWRTTVGTSKISTGAVTFGSPDRGWAFEECRRFGSADCNAKTGGWAFFTTTDGGRTWKRIGE